MKIYISGQVTGLSLDDAEDNFAFCAEHIRRSGHEPVNPFGVLPYHPDHKWEDYMLVDIKLLFGCDAIFLQKNWIYSKGARIERAIAIELQLQIIYQK